MAIEISQMAHEQCGYLPTGAGFYSLHMEYISMLVDNSDEN